MAHYEVSAYRREVQIKIRSILKIVGIPVFTAILFGPFTSATPENAKKEERHCQYCHIGVGKPDLNKAGEYYKKHMTLKGYKGSDESDTPERNAVRLLKAHH